MGSCILEISDNDKTRFWLKVNIREESECWPWIAGCCRDGYGSIGWRGRIVGAHRVAWELANNLEIPKGMVVRHSCDNRACCNPAHLLLGTQADNVLDAKERGRSPRPIGERNSHARLTRSDVAEIRKLLANGRSQTSIAEIFGVVAQTINNIATGYSWGWLEDSSESENS